MAQAAIEPGDLVAYTHTPNQTVGIVMSYEHATHIAMVKLIVEPGTSVGLHRDEIVIVPPKETTSFDENKSVYDERIMGTKVLVKRGLKRDLPFLAEAEIGLCIDTCEVFVGSAKGNILIGQSDSVQLDKIGKNVASHYRFGQPAPIDSYAWYDPQHAAIRIRVRTGVTPNDHKGCIITLSESLLCQVAVGQQYPVKHPEKIEQDEHYEAAPITSNRFTNVLQED